MTKMQLTAALAGLLALGARGFGERWRDFIRKLVLVGAVLAVAIAGFLPTVPVEAVEPTATATLVGPFNGPTPNGGIVQMGIEFDPALPEDSSIRVTLRGSSIEDFVDLEASGFNAILPTTALREVPLTAGTTFVELGIRILDDPLTRGPHSGELDLGLVPDGYQRGPRVSFIAGATNPTTGGPGAGFLPPGVSFGAFQGPASILSAHEGDFLQFGVAATNRPFEAVVRLELFFNAPNAASIEDLLTNGQGVVATIADSPTPVTVTERFGRYFIDVPFAQNQGVLPVRLFIAEDQISPEGDSAGLERLQVAVVDIGVGGPPSWLPENNPEGPPPPNAFAAPLDLTIQDVGPATAPDPGPVATIAPPAPTPVPAPVPAPAITGRSRVVLLTPPVAPVLDPVVGPLVAGPVTATLTASEVRLRLPAALQVWLSPNTDVRVRYLGSPVATVAGAPSTITFATPAGSDGSTQFLVEGRLRNGAPYSELVSLGTPTTNPS